jgi:hypothetical protein
MVLNNYWGFDIIYSFRLLFRFYIFYIAILNLELTDKQLKKINLFFLFCLCLQLPVVAYKFTIYGMSELTMGAYAVREGSLTTMLPIIVLLFAVPFYYMHQRNPLLILLCVSFIAFSIVGKKRAILFFLPLSILLLYFLIAFKEKHIHTFKKSMGLFLGVLASASIIIVVLVLNPTLNPEKKIGGSVDLDYVVTYTKNYEGRVDGEGYTTGRFSSSQRIFNVMLNKDIWKGLFGLGPGIITPSIFDKNKDLRIKRFIDREFKIKYGFTPMTTILIEYGFLGSFVYMALVVTFIFKCRQYYRNESVQYWRAFGAGAYGFSIFMLIFFLGYHPPAFLGDTIPLIYFYTMAVVVYRHRIQSNDNFYKLRAVA